VPTQINKLLLGNQVRLVYVYYPTQPFEEPTDLKGDAEEKSLVAMKDEDIVQVEEDRDIPQFASYCYTLMHYLREGLRGRRDPEGHARIAEIDAVVGEAEEEGEEVIDPNVVICILDIQLARIHSR
jgi:hypothetical protein